MSEQADQCQGQVPILQCHHVLVIAVAHFDGGVTVRPFELQQVPTLFANFGKKFKHETVDNIPDLAPAVIVFGAMMGCVSSTPAVALSHSNARAARMHARRA